VPSSFGQTCALASAHAASDVQEPNGAEYVPLPQLTLQPCVNRRAVVEDAHRFLHAQARPRRATLLGWWSHLQVRKVVKIGTI
jgi:hypothetical protein